MSDLTPEQIYYQGMGEAPEPTQDVDPVVPEAPQETPDAAPVAEVAQVDASMARMQALEQELAGLKSYNVELERRTKVSDELQARLAALEEKSKTPEKAEPDILPEEEEELGGASKHILNMIRREQARQQAVASPAQLPDELIADRVNKTLAQREFEQSRKAFLDRLNTEAAEFGVLASKPEFVKWANSTREGLLTVSEGLGIVNEQRKPEHVDYVKSVIERYKTDTASPKPQASPQSSKPKPIAINEGAKLTPEQHWANAMQGASLQ